MGNPDSFLYCRMHDMARALDTTAEQAGSAACALITLKMYEYAIAHEGDPSLGPMLAVVAAITSELEHKVYALQHLGDYDKPVEDAIADLVVMLQEKEDEDSDPEIELILAYFRQVLSEANNDAFSDDMRLNNHMAACDLLDKFLEREEGGTEFDPTWAFLAIYCNFETYHDERYGSPIVGPSPYDGKDQFGNDVRTTGATNVASAASKKGGCYVATAVYGSYDCPEVWTLRRFRDYRLSETWYGRMFVRVYYAVSPTAVRLFGHKRGFNMLLKPRLDRLVARLKEKGYADTQYFD